VKVACGLCPKECIINDGERGSCRIRVNIGGKLTSITYGYPCAVHVDPIEKKPLFHFYPGEKALSIATAGCNLHCKNCQNWEISQANPEDVPAYQLSPRQVVDLANEQNNPIIAYTYTDPAAYYEYALDTAMIARDRGIKNVLVTAGYSSPEPMKNIFKYVDAATVDVKFFDDSMYRKITTATLKPVLDGLILAKKMNVWLEVSHLIIPTLNDDFGVIKEFCLWIRNNLGVDTPLHFLRFYPQYLLKNLPTTPDDTLRTARDIARSVGLSFVYVGNLWEIDINTYCPYDGKLLIKRLGYEVVENNIINGACPQCKRSVEGRWR
jgi:pyruvate formate lyase activating enzyme